MTYLKKTKKPTFRGGFFINNLKNFDQFRSNLMELQRNLESVRAS